MKKIYLVYQDNGESYEDYYEWIKKVFDNKQEAENYKQMLEIDEETAFKKAVEENDYREKCRFWIKEEELIEKGDDDCEWRCKIIEEPKKIEKIARCDSINMTHYGELYKPTENEEILRIKINELIDEINKLKEND